MNDRSSPTIERLMLVDDSEFDQMMYRRVAQRSGIVESFVQFTEPLQALEHLLDQSKQMPSLVLLDINMPCLDGFEFLDIASERLGDRLCPVIIMLTTGLSRTDEQRAERHSMFREFCSKPLTDTVLARLARQHLADTPIHP